MESIQRKTPRVSKSESQFQSELIKWLKKQGCFVWKCQQNATTQKGVADLFICKEGWYGWLEVKKSRGARLRPGQKEFIEKMDEWSYAKIVYPENVEEVKAELGEILK